LVDLFECKQIALQLIPGHWQFAENEHADALAKNSAKSTQTHIRKTSYHAINTLREGDADLRF